MSIDRLQQSLGHPPPVRFWCSRPKLGPGKFDAPPKTWPSGMAVLRRVMTGAKSPPAWRRRWHAPAWTAQSFSREVRAFHDAVQRELQALSGTRGP